MAGLVLESEVTGKCDKSALEEGKRGGIVGKGSS